VCFLAEAAFKFVVLGEIGPHEFECDRDLAAEVEATVHVGHTAAVYEGINAVAVIEGLAG
jgi:hypothetical protein